MASRTSKRVVTIGAAPFEGTCPVPRDGIGWWEALQLTGRGWLDAARNRAVPDEAPTHTVLHLLARHRRADAEVVRGCDAALSAVDAELALLRAVLAEPAVEVLPEPSQDDLGDLDGAQRVRWVEQAREARASGARATRQQQQRGDAQQRLERALAARRALDVEAADVRRLWREAYAMRVARYTRARLVRWGRPVAAAPALAPYLPVEGPTVERVGP